MVKKYAGRYSKYLRPISIIFDLLVVSSFVYFFLDQSLFRATPIVVFSLLWVISAFITKFYEVYRFTKLIRIISFIFYQLLLFSILVFAFFWYSSKPDTRTITNPNVFTLYIYHNFIIQANTILCFAKLQARVWGKLQKDHNNRK